MWRRIKKDEGCAGRQKLWGGGVEVREKAAGFKGVHCRLVLVSKECVSGLVEDTHSPD